MPSRKVKTLFRNPNERSHREHRSKRGRKQSHRYLRDSRLMNEETNIKQDKRLQRKLKRGIIPSEYE